MSNPKPSPSPTVHPPASSKMHRCPWCRALHEGKFILCDEHEHLMRATRLKRGEPIREPYE